MKRSPQLSTRRDPFLEASKGLLILLVVIGHLVSNADTLDDQYNWYRSIRTLIYSFHMPLFMLLSGVTFELSLKSSKKENFFAFVARRGDRLLVPFFVVGLLLYIAKFSIAHLASSVPNLEVSDFLDGITGLFVDTSRSPVRSIWFVFVLFWITIVTDAFVRLGRPWVLILLCVGIMLYIIWLFQLLDVPQVFFLDRFFRYLHYFVFGFLFGSTLRRISTGSKLIYLYVLAAILLAGVSLTLGPNKISTTLMPIAMALILFRYASYVSKPFLVWIGQYTFIIYLLNTLFIGATTLVFRNIFPDVTVRTDLFIFFLVITTIIGVGGPIISRVFLLDKISFVSKYVR